jgi:hypothetical protein
VAKPDVIATVDGCGAGFVIRTVSAVASRMTPNVVRRSCTVGASSSSLTVFRKVL